MDKDKAKFVFLQVYFHQRKQIINNSHLHTNKKAFKKNTFKFRVDF